MKNINNNRLLQPNNLTFTLMVIFIIKVVLFYTLYTFARIYYNKDD